MSGTVLLKCQRVSVTEEEAELMQEADVIALSSSCRYFSIFYKEASDFHTAGLKTDFQAGELVFLSVKTKTGCNNKIKYQIKYISGKMDYF